MRRILASGLALGIFSGTAQADPVQLDPSRMDAVTAGAEAAVAVTSAAAVNGTLLGYDTAGLAVGPTAVAASTGEVAVSQLNGVVTLGQTSGVTTATGADYTATGTQILVGAGTSDTGGGNVVTHTQGDTSTTIWHYTLPDITPPASTATTALRR
jgi:hypothetical protein